MLFCMNVYNECLINGKPIGCVIVTVLDSSAVDRGMFVSFPYQDQDYQHLMLWSVVIVIIVVVVELFEVRGGCSFY